MPDDDPLVEGVFEHHLTRRARQVLDDPHSTDEQRGAAARALETCTRIGERVERERSHLIEVLRVHELDVEPHGTPGPRQNHTIELRVPSHGEAVRVADVLAEHGFRRWEQWTGAAGESFRRFATRMTVGRTTDVTTVVRIVWSGARRRGPLRRVFSPTAGDWAMVALPPRVWPAYSLVRPTRLVLERIGLRRRHEDGLGPFLATPESLIDPLLWFAGVDRDDQVVDIGCGDGRLVVEAAARLGCRAIGVERAPELVDAARARCAAAGVEELVEIVSGDARDVDLGDATVVFMFLPIDVATHLLGGTLERLAPGARLIVHEQMRLPPSVLPAPIESAALLGDDGVTVAHRWIAGRN